MRLNPRKAKARRLAAAETRLLSARIDECRLIAAWLWASTFDAMMQADSRAAIKAAWRRWKEALRSCISSRPTASCISDAAGPPAGGRAAAPAIPCAACDTRRFPARRRWKGKSASTASSIACARRKTSRNRGLGVGREVSIQTSVPRAFCRVGIRRSRIVPQEPRCSFSPLPQGERGKALAPRNDRVLRTDLNDRHDGRHARSGGSCGAPLSAWRASKPRRARRARRR